MTTVSSRFLSILPAYFGGKRTLAPWIFNTLQHAIPQKEWDQSEFIDLFMGGGSISLFAKTQGFKKICAVDCAGRSKIVAEAALMNGTLRLQRSHLLYLSQPIPTNQKPGLVESMYSPSVFSCRHAQILDQWLYWANQVQNTTLKALMKLVIWRCIYRFICIPTSVNTSNRPFAEALDGIRSWDSLNPKRFIDGSLDSLLIPSCDWLTKEIKTVNQGLFSGAPISFHQADALNILPNLQGDILYADPPYAHTSAYEKTFAVIDHLLTGHKQVTPSSFSKSTESLDTLFDSVRHLPTWMLSYGNQVLDLNALIALVQRHAGSRKVQGFAKAYKHLAHVSKSNHNQELLIIASTERKVISYAN
ncbi:DNA adenine methylase [Vampirovibrio sp.]|uniref:DNA adenine methylase n=1 Tax=Vampirovibrio sp. TaxID=2717857 RepID=UPI0035946B85